MNLRPTMGTNLVAADLAVFADDQLVAAGSNVVASHKPGLSPRQPGAKAFCKSANACLSAIR
jgi:hypothetical protein